MTFWGGWGSPEFGETARKEGKDRKSGWMHGWGPPEMSPEVRYRYNYAMYFAFIGATTQGLGQGGGPDPLFPSTPVAQKRNARSVNDFLIPRVQPVTDVIRVVEPVVVEREMCWHCVACRFSLLLFEKSPRSMGRGHAYTFPICTFPNKQKEANKKSWRDQMLE